jgi:hypothetical protein
MEPTGVDRGVEQNEVGIDLTRPLLGGFARMRRAVYSAWRISSLSREDPARGSAVGHKGQLQRLPRSTWRQGTLDPLAKICKIGVTFRLLGHSSDTAARSSAF